MWQIIFIIILILLVVFSLLFSIKPLITGTCVPYSLDKSLQSVVFLQIVWYDTSSVDFSNNDYAGWLNHMLVFLLLDWRDRRASK